MIHAPKSNVPTCKYFNLFNNHIFLGATLNFRNGQVGKVGLDILCHVVNREVVTADVIC